MKNQAINHYTYKITWSESDGECVGLCVEFPSLSFLDKDPEAALHGIRELVADVIEDLKENNEPIPEPLASKKYTGKFVVRVPPETHRKLALQAAEDHVSLNRLVSEKLAFSES